MNDMSAPETPLDIRDEGPVRILTMQHGAMNVLTRSLRTALWDALEAAEAAPHIRAVLLMSGRPVWSAGADLGEMDSGEADADPNPAQLVYDLLPSLKTPVVAVLSGMALGGGLELALSCHYRLMAPEIRIGLPEVTLGLLPGAGGTQLLPRAIGLEEAANIILSGRPVTAGQFAGTLLFDAALGSGDPLGEALAFAKALPDGLPHLSQRSVSHGAPEAFLQALRTKFSDDPRRTSGHLPAIDCLEAAASLPFSGGRRVEQQKFLQARAAPEGAALRYGFVAERGVANVPGLKGAAARKVGEVAVIGAGTMGQGIAMACADAGLKVRLLDLSEAALNRALDAIAARYETSVERGRLTPETAKAAVERIQPAATYSGIAACDLVIEAVVENMDVKKAVFETLGREMKPGAVLASNTSTLDLNGIAQLSGRPGDVVGLHFFNPANVMRLLEVVQGAQTAPDVLATALAFGKKLRKVAVVSGVCDGFIGNRMIEFYLRQALYMVEEGATPFQVDRALETWGMAMGPFRMMDLVGNDVNDAIRARRLAADPDLRLPHAPDILRDRGWHGNKTGKGWYLHDSKHPAENTELSEALAAWRRENGIAPRMIGDEEIVDRCVFALVNVAAALLDEGIALRGSDIDTVYLTGFGFPGTRGGPLYHANTVGLRTVRRKMRGFAQLPHGDADLWKPHPLLERSAETGQPLGAAAHEPLAGS